MPKLSFRLEAICSLVPFGARVCDIGTDHGYLSIELVKQKKAKSVIATDINEKPLSRARKNIALSGVEGISLRLCDGLSGVNKGETDCVIIAGMGGEVIAKIIEDAKDILNDKAVTIILQPTTSPEFLRKFLANNGFEIQEELPIFENGKLYTAMRVCYVGMPRRYEEFWYFIGDLSPLNENGKRYIEKQYLRCFKCMKSLENTKKVDEFNYYKSICDGINNYLAKAFKSEPV